MRRVLVASKTCRVALPESELRNRFIAVGFEPEFASLAEKKKALDDFDAIVVGTDVVDEGTLSSARRLSLIQKFGVGLDAIDVEAAKARGIAVRNLPSTNSGAVAEMAFALMLSLARCVVHGDRLVRQGEWPRLVGTSLRGKTLGIVGTGAIGTELARLSRGFDMQLLGYDVVESETFRDIGGRYTSLDELLVQADVVSLHVPLCEATRHLIDRDRLGCMKPTALLVNAARGGVVDEAALSEALEHGWIAGAALDVLEREPAAENPLLAFSNVICTPHIAAYDADTLNDMVDSCLKSMVDFFSDERGEADAD